MTLQAIGYYALAPKSESPPIPHEFLDRIRGAKILYDNDEVGRKYANELALTYDFDVVYTEKKDPFEQVIYGGQRSLKEI